MHLKYGTHEHAPGECVIAITRTERVAETGVPIGYAETWQIDGLLMGSGADPVADLTSKINALEAAYAVQYLDLKLVTSEGADTAHKLISANSVGGVRVVSPSYPNGTGAEYATVRSYRITATAEFDTILSGSLVSWVETLAFSGGGPRYVWQQPLSGNSIKQRVATNTPYRLVQSGMAVGRTSYPTPAAQLLPADLIVAPEYVKEGPDIINGVFRNYKISWRYIFESVAAISHTSYSPTLPSL